jgi:hypothetical protein
MRERAMSRPGVSKRRCKRREMSPRCMCVASLRQGACHPSSVMGIRGTVDGFGRAVSSLVCVGSEFAAGWVTVGFAGGFVAPSTSMSSD